MEAKKTVDIESINIDYIYNLFISYINSKKNYSPLEFFIMNGVSQEDFYSLRKIVYENNRNLYDSFIDSWKKKNIRISKKEKSREKQKVSKILYLIDNVKDLDLVEFWKILPFKGSDSPIVELMAYVKMHHESDYPNLVNFLASNGFLQQNAFQYFDIDIMKSITICFDEKKLGIDDNEFIEEYMKKFNIPFVNKAYYDVLMKYLNEENKMVEEVYPYLKKKKKVKTKKVQLKI